MIGHGNRSQAVDCSVCRGKGKDAARRCTVDSN